MPIAKKLTGWFNTHQRILPFRENKDPYRIWVSEIMLQQTQVDTVLPYYDRFMEAFPTVFDLAQASEDQVIKHWEGLGYYSRAKNLLKCAQELVNSHQGVFPADYDTVLQLPGIGPYTAGAILSIAYEQKIPAVDGNVMRVISRLYALSDDIATPKTRKRIESVVLELIPDNAGDFNQGLMELGALICTPLNPKCGQCPLIDECKASALGLENQLPIKKKKPASQTFEVAAGILSRGGRYLLIRNQEGLLSGLWGFPLAEASTKIEACDNLIQTVTKVFGYTVEGITPLGAAKHVFSHKTWNITVYGIEISPMVKDTVPGSMDEGTEIKWLNKEEIAELAISTAFKKVMKFLR